ncbi:MAG: hypothetical protein HQK99_02695 [Nitrospirae bacterium]|nr:hypothetical protein [Nitrospirota bacterium]
MADTCWIKDEHGRFIGRRPGCKMEKSGGVREISDKKTNDDEAASEAALEEEAKAHGKSVEDYKKEKRAMEILSKPQSQWTEEDKQFLKNYDSLEANPAGNPVDAIAFALAGPMAGIARTVAGNIAMDITMDRLTKYAEENFPGYGAIGVVLAGIALALTKGKSGAAAEEKAAAAVAEEKASAAAAEKSAAEEAERKAAAEAERKAAAEAEEKAAAAVAEEKAAEESAKTKEKLGEFYDEGANYKHDPRADARKQANKVNIGDIDADRAKKMNELAEKAANEEAAKAVEKAKRDAASTGRQLPKEDLDPSKYKKPATKFDGYKTEASQFDIEHSMRGHASYEVKKRISDARAAHGEAVSPKYTKAKEDRVVRGKHNVSLTKEDYQNIEKNSKEAIDNGNIEFLPATTSQPEKVDCLVPQEEVKENGVFIKKGGDIHIRYKVDPVNKKLTFETMYKEGYE